MAIKTAKTKNAAAVALGRKGGQKGGPARAAKLTREERSASARKAVQARWAKAKEGKHSKIVKSGKRNKIPIVTSPMDTSDQAVLALLKRIKETDDRKQIRQLADQLERVIFHKHANV